MPILRGVNIYMTKNYLGQHLLDARTVEQLFGGKDTDEEITEKHAIEAWNRRASDV